MKHCIFKEVWIFYNSFLLEIYNLSEQCIFISYQCVHEYYMYILITIRTKLWGLIDFCITKNTILQQSQDSLYQHGENARALYTGTRKEDHDYRENVARQESDLSLKLYWDFHNFYEVQKHIMANTNKVCVHCNVMHGEI